MHQDLTIRNTRGNPLRGTPARKLVGRGLLWLMLMLAYAGCGEQEPIEGQLFAAVANDFSDTLLFGLGSPTDIAFTPDGRMLVTTQPGKLRVAVNGALQATAALDLSNVLCTNSERGLLGVAVDPDFANNHYIYLYHTFKRNGSCATNDLANSPVNRVSRFTFDPATNTASRASEKVLIDNILSLNGNHNGGDLAFGSDGMLYVTVGDSGCQIGGGNCAGANTNGKFLSNLNGKILRINKDGTIPATNPFVNANGARACAGAGSPATRLDDSQPCKEIFAYGLRNPFRFAFKPGTSTFYINDVGQDVWEEIDEGKLGANYGWNTREGMCVRNSTNNCGAPPAGLTNPLYAYGRGQGCKSITGGAFVPAGVFGTSFDGAYLFADYVCGKIFKLTGSGNNVQVSDFATALGNSSVVGMAFGPSARGQSLYYRTYATGGQVRRIDYTGVVNRAPTASFSASPSAAAAPPLAVHFDGSASADPDGDSLRYLWTFGDGASTTTTTPTVDHTYTTSNKFTASLVVQDARGASSAAVTQTITTNNTPPVITLDQPTANATFVVGQSFTLSAHASDAQDGALPAQSLSWTVLLHHNSDHTHPYFGPTAGNNLTVPGAAPENLAATEQSYLEIQVTAKDSGGLTSTLSRELDAKHVALTFQTNPAGLSLRLNDELTVTGPRTITSWQGFKFAVQAPDQADAQGVRWTFASWSDGGAAQHTLTTPASATTYTANFVRGAFKASINFQPAGAPVPAGYVADTGAPFGARNGLRYGWNAANDTTTRDRNSASSRDQRYDTLIHLQKPENPNASWEIELPNGSYDVHVVAGDPDHIDSVFRVSAEGQTILSGTPTANTHWFEATQTVTVSDGRLTLGNGQGASNNKLCFVDITAR